ncbi:MAG: DUF1178 family protein [Henriciella sp.]|jgi:hypothetical protein
MIRYALTCEECDACFDAWFAGSQAFDKQAEAGQLQCPQCDGTHVVKQVMAPSVSGTKKTSGPDPEKVFGRLAAKARQHVAENFDYVSDGFAHEARAMHYGDIEHRPIWGETTAEEREALADEGVPATPLHPAFVPRAAPDDKDIN